MPVLKGHSSNWLRDVFGLPENKTLWQAGRFVKRSHKFIVALRVQEILEEQIAKKLV